MLLKTRNIVLLSLALSFFYSCKPGVPSGILSQGDMEEVLYDYHIAKGLANQKSSDSISYYTRYYQQKVFEKHDIDEACFDSSMIWYSRHTERLSDIYKHLAEQMGSSSGVVAGSNLLEPGESSANGDTLNMWPLTNTLMLHSKAANYSVFREKADTLIKPGDNILWKFNADWYYSEGNKQGIAVLLARFKNDSTIHSVRQLYETSNSMELKLYIGNDSVKEVEGFIYQMAPWTKRPRMVSVSDIQLLRIKGHRQTPPAITPSSLPLMQQTGM